MDSSTLLDYALFQLTPTRTRCDLVLFYGGKSEKLASGLFEPFILHLQFIKDQISKVGYSIKLCPPAKNAPWFTKGTFERFVRFVSTPAVLERFVNLEREILQIEESAVQANELSNTNVAGQLEEGSGPTANTITRKSSDSSKLKDELEKSDHAALEGNSKIQFQRLLEARKTLLHKEQAMAYARGLVVGFEVDNINDLISFADAFGASRLREACNNFKELCKKKHSDGLWMKELAAMEACPPSELSFLGTSGIVLANEISSLNQNVMLNLTNNGVSTGDFMPNGSSDASRSDSTADSRKDGSMGTSDQIASTRAEVQVPMQWPNQIPPYMYNFQGPIPQFPPYQGYPFPTMQPIPPNYPINMQWPSSMKEFSQGKKDKSLNKKGNKYSGEDRKTDSSDSEGRSDSDSHIDQNKNNSSIDVPYRKKHRKKSSKTVVIRNINYITPKRRNGGSDSFSDETSSDEDEYIDGDTIKKKVDDAVGSLEKLRKSNSSTQKRKGSNKSNHKSNGSSDAPDQDFDDGLVSNASRGVMTNESWDTFQSLLMKDDDTVDNGVEKLQPVDVRDEHFIVRSSGDGTSLRSNRAMDLGSEKLLNRMLTGDSFVVSQKDGEHEDRVRLEDIENAEMFRPIMKRRDSADEDLVCSQRLEESGSGPRGILSRSTESSIIKPGKGDDWFVINHSGKPENQDAANYLLSIEGDSSNAKSSRRDVLVDDSFMVHARSAVDDSYDSQWKTDISMAADLTLSSQAENGTAEHNRMDPYEPDDLCVVLERDSGFESRRESWVTDQGIDISFMEGHRSSYAESGDHTEKKLPSNSDKITVKKNGINGRKVPEVRTKTVLGSPGKNRNEMMSKSKKSSFVSRPTVQKSKQEKEEEIRKKMEELAIQRQKRIAERTAAAGGAQVATKRASLESKSFKGSAKSDKNKIIPTPERRTR
ncbi:COP1-INTERACTING PROTEIN-RELATED [Salix viminalis]|uniref:COP1-INTERACTING PROTEIN-RELATED n=1 Tax=Salix viminalis TaxID=40686 RepID=A0A9Q0QIC9_SALVM|nr:COP1-INTERACTING PROTEIN-RELATED [Salix viminalis]